jgi:hypothetical protein
MAGGTYQGSPASESTSTSSGTQQSTGQQQSASYIPDYSQTPILNEIAQYSRQMAPQVYQWGMDQFNKNQGNIDSMMRDALSYASPQRQAVDMGQAEAGVQQASEAARQSAMSDLQSYGIDPSAGRYAGLDQANRVQAAASTAGAGNQQRMADVATGNAMQQQAISSSMQNATNVGYGASNAANALLGTAMSLKYPPLGTVSSGTSQSSGSNVSSSQSLSSGAGPVIANFTPGYSQHFGGVMAEGGTVGDNATTGGFVSNNLSPSNGAQTDDVDARLNAGEFVIPRDVTQWLGQQHFYKLMAQARKARATAGNSPQVGYGAN